MDKLLQAAYDLICSGDPKKILKGIEQTQRLPEPLALGLFALVRQEIRGNADLDADALEAAIAATNRVGLNAPQVAEQLAAHLNQRASLTETQYRLVATMLAAVRPAGALPALRKHQVIQLEALAELVCRADEPAARRALERGLYDWRGQPRADTTALVNTLPFLRPDIESFRRRAPLAYVATLAGNMRKACAEGRASAGFFFVSLVILLVVTIVTAFAGTRPPAAAPPTVPPTSKAEPAPTVASCLAQALTEPIRKRLQGTLLVVLDDEDAPAVLAVLSQASDARLISANGAFGRSPGGCTWLEVEDLKLVRGLPEEGKLPLVVACFMPPGPYRQLQFISLPSREILLAVRLPDTASAQAVPSATLLAEADEHLKSGDSARARLALRQAAAAALTRAEQGRVHRSRMALLFAQNAPREEIGREVRLALQRLPQSEQQTIPEALRREFSLAPGFTELEQQMTTTRIPSSNLEQPK